MIALLLAGRAFATDYTVDVCVRIGIDFNDVNVGEDYMTSNTDVTARGAHIKVQRTDVLPYQTVADDYGIETGGQTGCLQDIVLNSARTYKTTVYSQAYVNGQWLNVYVASGGTTLSTYTSANYTPASAATWTTTTTTSPDWNIFAAGSYSIWRDDLGDADHSIVAFSQACPGFSFSCFDGSSVYISDGGSAFKYQIAHEFGHALLYYQYNSSGSNQTATPGACLGDLQDTTGTGHHFISKEYNGAAFWEGFANYYATVAFNNNTTDTDGTFFLYKNVDWNRDGVDEEAAQAIDISSASPTIQDALDDPTSFTVDGSNYEGAYCTANGNHGTEYDWVRFLWYLDTNRAMAPANFADIYVEARAGTYYTTGTGAGAGYPSTELRTAAVALNSTWGTDWNSYDGVFGVAY